MTPIVSVLINNHNYGRFVGAAIDSALEQSHELVEVVVVDDGSTDESRGVIEGYGGSITAIFKPNGGQASAFNAGFAACRGSIVCFLDADDRFRNDKVERVVSVFAEHPDIGWCFHGVDRRRAGGEVSVGGSRQRRSGRRDLRWPLRLGVVPFAAPPTSALCFGRALLGRILPMPEQRGIAVSDNYLKTVALALAPGYFLDEALTVMLVHEDNLSHAEIERTELQATRFVSLGVELRKTPGLRLLADRRFAKGLNRYRILDEPPSDLTLRVERYLRESTLAERAGIELFARFLPFRQGR